MSVASRSPFMQRRSSGPVMATRSLLIDKRRIPDHGWSDHSTQMAFEEEPYVLERPFSFDGGVASPLRIYSKFVTNVRVDDHRRQLGIALERFAQ